MIPGWRRARQRSDFEKYGFDPVFKETPGGHTWLVWRDYLIEFVPLLFGNGTSGKS
jgi:enterochelin esterase-like enzyme